MRPHIVASLKAVLLFTIACGVLYPLLMTAFASLLFNHKAQGSLIERNGQVIGSELIAQKFESDRYFWPRPSVIGYQPLPSGASNSGPTSAQLKQAVEQRRKTFTEKNGLSPETHVPAEMLFASASGIDPHISMEAAELQVNRVAHARGFDNQRIGRLRSLIQELTDPPQFGFLGEPRVNVLLLNIAVDRM